MTPHEQKRIHLLLSISVKMLFLLAILSSIASIYQRYVIEEDFVVLYNDSGPDMSDFEPPQL
jgi:hypothetical protein